ncbi:MAG: response regulator [SAR324 cluster bacterium]|nr:response regulator [SAR324 cluster bacterium]
MLTDDTDKTIRILVIDDDALILHATSQTLRSAGYEVIEALTGREGLRLATEIIPELILLDVELPDLHGFDVCRSIKADPALAHTYVMMISGIKIKSEHLVEGLEIGADDYVVRPVPNRELLKRVQIALRIKQTEEELKQHRDQLEQLVEKRTAELQASNAQLQQEITERKQIEDKVNKLALAVEYSPSMVMITDSNGIIEYVNPRFVEITGIPAQTITGKNANTDLGLPTSATDDQAALWNKVRSGQLWKGEFHNKRHDGTFYYEEASIAPLTDESGRITHYIKIANDITERRQLESQVRQSQKLDALGTLAGGIAHEYNNILAIIQGYGDLLLSRLPENGKEKHYVEKIREAGKRAVDLTKQILTFSQMDSQKLRVQYLTPLISESLKMMRATLPVTIDIQHNLDPGCSPILADSSQIHQVLVNLFTNASHAMETTGGVLKISLQEKKHHNTQEVLPKLKTDTFLKLTVQDTGCGIPSEDQEKIFDPFFTTRQVGQGRGFGLSVVHSIIEKHGGAITVESVINQGTAFHIYLPISHETVHEAQEKKKQERSLYQGKGHILVVDDEEALVVIHEALLTDIGYEVTSFTDALEALAKFQESPSRFDLVFTDFTMPHLTGDQLSQQLLKIHPDIPIIMATGYSSMISKEKAKSIGIREFMMKPIDNDQLVATIQKLLNA